MQTIGRRWKLFLSLKRTFSVSHEEEGRRLRHLIKHLVFWEMWVDHRNERCQSKQEVMVTGSQNGSGSQWALRTLWTQRNYSLPGTKHMLSARHPLNWEPRDLACHPLCLWKHLFLSQLQPSGPRWSDHRSWSEWWENQIKQQRGRCFLLAHAQHRWDVAFSLFSYPSPSGGTQVSVDFYLGDQLPLRFTLYTKLPGNVIRDELEMDWAPLPRLSAVPPCLPRNNFFLACYDKWSNLRHCYSERCGKYTPLSRA